MAEGELKIRNNHNIKGFEVDSLDTYILFIRSAVIEVSRMGQLLIKFFTKSSAEHNRSIIEG